MVEGAGGSECGKDKTKPLEHDGEQRPAIKGEAKQGMKAEGGMFCNQ